MARGRYISEDELLRDALRALQDQDRAVGVEDPVVVEGIRRGLDQMDQGLGRPFNEFDAEFKAERKIS